MTDILWTTDEAAKVVDGTPFGQWECTGISIDSRNVEKGDLFIAIKGPSFDGHQFVHAALKAGAAAAVVSHIPQNCRQDDKLLLVKNTTRALEDLGRAARARSNAKIVAVTGSVGKTGVKEALASVLSKQGKTHATLGNLNNHFGLPLTLARMPRDCTFAVLELGMNHAGELIELSQMAQPDVAVITTVAAAHLEYFEDEAAIADAKCEIFAGLKKGGAAVLNVDNPYFERMKQACLTQGVDNIITFASEQDATFSATSFENDETENGTFISAIIHGQPLDYKIAHDGRHWVANSLAVLACIEALGADVKQAANDLAHLSQLKGRGAVHTIELSGGNLRVIDESYNANDASMRAALDVLSHQSGRRIAVLGDMLELGPDEIDIHKNLADACKHIHLVFACGPLMKHLFKALPAPQRGAHASSAEHLAPLVVQAVQPGDVISIKSSRGSRTDLVLDALLELQSNGT